MTALSGICLTIQRGWALLKNCIPLLQQTTLNNSQHPDNDNSDD